MAFTVDLNFEIFRAAGLDENSARAGDRFGFTDGEHAGEQHFALGVVGIFAAYRNLDGVDGDER